MEYTSIWQRSQTQSQLTAKSVSRRFGTNQYSLLFQEGNTMRQIPISESLPMYQLAFLKDGQTIALAELPIDVLELDPNGAAKSEIESVLWQLLQDADRRVNPLRLEEPID
jgi:hypothetical protein